MLDSYRRYINADLAMKRDLPKGAPSPSFVDYENYNGGKTSLADLKGKYVYIDVWATWCGPCKAEIPSLKKIEKEYHGKNIAFVSVVYSAKILNSANPAHKGIDFWLLGKKDHAWKVMAINNEIITPNEELPKWLDPEY